MITKILQTENWAQRLLKNEREGVLYTTAQATIYRAQVKRELEPYLERPFTDYYQKKAALYEKYSISADTCVG
jgi:hypothetical protein